MNEWVDEWRNEVKKFMFYKLYIYSKKEYGKYFEIWNRNGKY